MHLQRLRFAAPIVCLLSLPAAAQNIDEMSLSDAAHYCRAGDVKALLDRGVDINSQNSGGYTPLMMAVTYGCEEVVRMLLERGADTTIENASGWDAAYLAKINNYRKIQAMLAQPAPAPAPQPQPAPAPAPRPGGAAAWPALGAYQVGQTVLYSGTAGKTWDSGVIRSIDPVYGYNIEGLTGSYDPFLVVGIQREPFWTNYFVGDWRVSVPMAMGTVTDGTWLYRTVTGGMRLPPLRIEANGNYYWRVMKNGGEQLIRGKWVPNPQGPGVILKNAEQGADWLVYNNNRTGSTLGQTVILSSDCCTYYDGTRL